jgi:DNA polymerase-3 subunit delta
VGPERSDSVETFRGEELSWARLVDVARTPSLFSPRRAVVARGAEGIKGDEGPILDYLEAPAPQVLVVLLAVRIDRRRTLWKRLAERAECVVAEPLKGRALRAEVQRRVAERGLSLTQDGLDELLERVGQDLRRLMGEIEKLEAYGLASGPIGAEHVAQVLGRGIARPLWEMADAWWDRDGARVLALAEESLDAGEAPLRVLATLHRSLRHLRGAGALRERRARPDEVASRLQVMPFKVQHLLRSLDRWPEADMRRVAALLGKVDRTLKSQSGVDPRVVLTAAVAAACGGGGVRPSRTGR